MKILKIKSDRNFQNKGSLGTLALDQWKRKEGPTVFHLFCFLTGIFLGNEERVKLGLWVSLVYCFTGEGCPCFEFVLVLDLVQEAALLSNYAIFQRGCVYG